MIRSTISKYGVAITVAALLLVVIGVAYALQIQRSVPGSGVIGQAQTVGGTILLWESLNPKTDLTAVSFGELDLDAFGNLVTPARKLVWVENGGGTSFDLTVEATSVQVDGTPTVAALRILFGPAGGELLPAPAHIMTIDPGEVNMFQGELALEFLKTPAGLGGPGTEVSFDVVFKAEGEGELPNNPPVADAGGPYIIDVGQELTLDGSASSDPDAGDSIVNYEWDLDNDGLFDDAVGQNPNVPFSELQGLPVATPNPIALRVTDSHGLTDSDATTLTIFDNRPTSVANANPNPADTGQEVTFDGSGSSHGHPGRSIVSYQWDFDYDGTNFDIDSSGIQVIHTYGSAGTFTVALRVTDDNAPAKTDIATVDVVVNPAVFDLAAAIVAANPGDTINIPTGTHTVASDLVITKDLTLVSAGAASTIIQAAANPGVADHRVFTVIASLVISDVTIRNGNGIADGGAIKSIGTLTINNSTISGNNTAAGPGGGAIWNDGTLTLTNSTVSGNTAGSGGAGGGIANIGTMALNNSTVSGNTAPSLGGGIFIQGTLAINNSTISGNSSGTAGGGGGMFTNSIGSTTFKNTIIGGNTGAGDPSDCAGTGPLTSEDHNLVGDLTGCTIVGITTNNITGQDPLLDILADNGGPTQTHALTPLSPAIDTGNPATPGSGVDACEATDQRGVARPQGTTCDIGAFEFVPGPIQPPAGMVGWWPGDGNANDIAGSNHGTLQGGATFAAGMVGQAFSLDGDGDWIELVGASALSLTDSDFTVDAWVNLSNPRHIDPVLGTLSALHLAAAHGGQNPYMGFWFNDTGGTTVISANTWYHLAWRYTKSTGEQAIFVNGTLDGSSTGRAAFQGTGTVYIGRSIGSQPFTGLIDEVGIFNRPLTDPEIKAIYDAGSAGKQK